MRIQRRRRTSRRTSRRHVGGNGGGGGGGGLLLARRMKDGCSSQSVARSRRLLSRGRTQCAHHRDVVRVSPSQRRQSQRQSQRKPYDWSHIKAGMPERRSFVKYVDSGRDGC